MEQSILNYAESSFSGNIPHPAMITLMCIKRGVAFNETEERCLRSSPLTLTRVLKAPTQGEEVKISRKRKRVAIKLPRETTPVVEEEPKIEERGGGGGEGFEDYPEQLVLFPRAKEETMPTQNILERGNRRAEE